MIAADRIFRTSVALGFHRTLVCRMRDGGRLYQGIVSVGRSRRPSLGGAFSAFALSFDPSALVRRQRLKINRLKRLGVRRFRRGLGRGLSRPGPGVGSRWLLNRLLGRP